MSCDAVINSGGFQSTPIHVTTCLLCDTISFSVFPDQYVLHECVKVLPCDLGMVAGYCHLLHGVFGMGHIARNRDITLFECVKLIHEGRFAWLRFAWLRFGLRFFVYVL